MVETASPAYPTGPTNDRVIVDQEWLAQNPDYSQPWLAGRADANDEDADFDGIRFWKAKRKTWWKRSQNTILRNPLIPLLFRSIVWITSAIALGLAGSIYHLTNSLISDEKFKNTPSTKMAITVDAVAMVYILYITYDEYTGKPLGLRSARAKMRLLFLDLVFIVFDSANLSLAFEGLIYQPYGACGVPEKKDNGTELSSYRYICQRQKALASVLLIALVAWLLTFSTSVLRVVERVNHR